MGSLLVSIDAAWHQHLTESVNIQSTLTHCPVARVNAQFASWDNY